jgi:two-component system chemotaxis response regulator CheY
MSEANVTRTLIVDDNMVARVMLRNMLGRIDKMETVGEIGTGQDAVVVLQDTEPDLVLLEATVAGTLSLVDIIKQMKTLKPEVKIIICADGISMDLVMPGIEAGALDFVLKPYKKELLEQSIRRVMESQQEHEY